MEFCRRRTGSLALGKFLLLGQDSCLYAVAMQSPSELLFRDTQITFLILMSVAAPDVCRELPPGGGLTLHM